MAGFGTTLSKLIEDDRQYYRAKAEKRKDYLQTYGTKAVVDIEGKANDALAVANQLQNYGFSKEFVTGITAKGGVRSMYDFADQVLKRTDLTPADIKELETSAIDFVSDNPDQDLETVINRAYGLYKSESDPVKRKTSVLGAMLGLDAQALEEDVLNRYYYNGYSGTDLTRIAATSGPKAGKPLGIKLPPKPLSVSELNTIGKSIGDQFDTSLSLEIDKLQAIITAPATSVEARRNAQLKHDNLIELQTLAKSNEGLAMGKYISEDQYNGGDFLTYLQGIEANRLGAVSNNFLLGEYFKTAYKTLSGDMEDDATTETSANAPQSTAGESTVVTTTAPQSTAPQSTVVTTPKSYTQDAIQAAIDKGDIKVGDTIVVDDQEIVVKQGFIDTYTKVTPPVGSKPEVDAEAARINEIRERQQSAMAARFQKWIAPLMTPAADQGYGNTESGMTPFGPISYTSSPMDDVPTDDSWKDSSYLLPADADELSDAVIRGEKVSSFLSKTSDYVNTKGYTYMDVGKAGLANAMSSVIDFGRGLFNSSKEDSSAEWSRKIKESGDFYAERAADIAAMGWKEYMQLNTDEVVPDEVQEEVKSGFFDWFTGPEDPIGSLMEMIGVGTEAANGAKKTNAEIVASAREILSGDPRNAEIVASARAMLSDEANARIDAGTNIIEQGSEESYQAFMPEFPGDMPDNLEEATAEQVSKALRFLTEIPTRSHQFLFDLQDNINTSIASLFEETLEERIMKNEGQRNRVVALQALKDKITEMRKAAEAEESGEPEPLVTRRKKPIEPKGMTASDKARLKRAQKADELSGDSSLLDMLVEKYGSALVQKEMGY